MRTALRSSVIVRSSAMLARADAEDELLEQEDRV
jgi:hypothetical protein